MRGTIYQADPFHIVACGVFSPALDCLALEKRFSKLTITSLPAQLHLTPQLLRNQLLQTVTPSRHMNIPVILLYGNCFPGMDDFCRDYGIKRIRGEHCYEIMLGGNRFREIMNETAGTYFLEQNLITHFGEYCVEPLELDDEEMRKLCFTHYRKLVYLRQPNDPDLSMEVKSIGEFLKLPADTVSVDYSHLKKRLLEFIDLDEP